MDMFSFVDCYTTTLNQHLKSIQISNLLSIAWLMDLVRDKEARFFVGGNGGSAAISDHLCCDWGKGSFKENQKPLKVHSLVSNTALLTAIGNDMGYEKTLKFQLQLAGICSKDAVMLISSSGNSPNIVEAALYAKEKNARVIGLTGFSGGKLKEIADIGVHIPVDNYGIVEDAHQSIMHILSQYHTATYEPLEGKKYGSLHDQYADTPAGV